MVIESDIIILGGGLAGLSAASVLGNRAILLEQTERPGGLAKTECYDGYWFDHVLHILYFQDKAIETRIHNLLREDLSLVSPKAWVETRYGISPFPLQMHLGTLHWKKMLHCLMDLAKVKCLIGQRQPANYQEFLHHTFGKALCDIFFFPYNRKMWKQPLEKLATSGFLWNITQPQFKEVLRGVLRLNDKFRVYNANGWYPHPSIQSDIRGMEVLTRALTKRVHDLRLHHRVEALDLKNQLVRVWNDGENKWFRYQTQCLSTIPLPTLINICKQTPLELKQQCKKLKRNRVYSVMFSIRGSRPEGKGHWRYYPDESLLFTRLIFMHEFDPHSAPANGWGLMAEVTEPAEYSVKKAMEIIPRVETDIKRIGVLPENCEIIDKRMLVVDPAYVVFSIDNQAIIEQARAFFRDHRITLLGRYGRWEYSSMAKVMQDAFLWCEENKEVFASKLEGCRLV